MFTAFAASVVFGRVVLGSLPDRLGPVRMTLVAGATEAVGLTTLALASSLPVPLTPICPRWLMAGSLPFDCDQADSRNQTCWL